MKTKLLFLMGLVITFMQGQVSINTDGSDPHASAMLDIKATDKGLLIPRMTATERDNIASPATGLLVYVTDDNAFYYYDGSSWKNLSTDKDWEINGNNIYNANPGFVGIGTSSPTAILHLEDTAGSTDLINDGFEDGTLSPFGGDWEVSTQSVNSGTYAARSTNYNQNSSTSTLSLSVTVPSGQNAQVSFAYRVSSESGWDFLRFYIDGVQQNEWSGDSGWQTYTANLSPGSHTLEWKYEKDGSVSDGDDRGFVDDVKITLLRPLLKIVDGNQADGYVLVSDANGAATWKDPKTSGISYWSANGNDIYNNNTGNVGVGTSSPSYLFHVTGDQSGNPVLYASNTNSSDAGSYGVYGRTSDASSGSSAGVYGYNSGSSHGIGVLGRYLVWGVSVAGIAWGTSTSDIPQTSGGNTMDVGVFGSADFDPAVGVYGYCPNDTTGYAGYFDGNFAVTGTKSASVPTSRGNQLVYSLESPEIWFEDYGQAQLSGGQTHIALDEMFLETVFIDEKHPMLVFVQEMGESNGLYVIPDADNKGFTVKEKNGGRSNIAFSYRIMAKRRFYQDYRFGVDPVRPLSDNLSKAKYHRPRTTNPKEMQRILERAAQRKQAQIRASQPAGKAMVPAMKKPAVIRKKVKIHKPEWKKK